MKIAIVRSYPLAGTTHYNVQEIGLAKALSHAAEVLLILPGLEYLSENTGHLSTEYHPVWRLGKKQQFPRGLYKSLERFRPDVLIVGADTQISSVIVARLGKALGAQVWLYQGAVPEKLRQRVQLKLMDVFLRSAVKGVLAKTPQAEYHMNQRGYGNVHVVGVGIDPERFQNSPEEHLIRAELGICSGDKILLHVGELSLNRGADITLSILRNIVELNNDYVAILVGDGPLRHSQFLNHPRIKAVGRVPQSMLPAYYKAADVLVNPCPSEIYGMSLLEAFYFGCHCIAYGDAPGPKHLGSLFPNRIKLVNSLDEEEWNREVQNWVSFGGDQRSKVGTSAVLWGEVVKKYLSVLRQSDEMEMVQ